MARTQLCCVSCLCSGLIRIVAQRNSGRPGLRSAATRALHSDLARSPVIFLSLLCDLSASIRCTSRSAFCTLHFHPPSLLTDCGRAEATAGERWACKQESHFSRASWSSPKTCARTFPLFRFAKITVQLAAGRTAPRLSAHPFLFTSVELLRRAVADGRLQPVPPYTCQQEA